MAVQQTVAALMGCLLREDPGFSCPLVQARMPSLPCTLPCMYHPLSDRVCRGQADCIVVHCKQPGSDSNAALSQCRA